MKTYLKLGVLVFATLIAFNLAHSGTLKNPSGMSGMKFGYFGAGTLTVEAKNTTFEMEFDTWSDVCGGINLDFRIATSLYLGVTADLAKIYVDDRNKEALFVMGTMLKGRFNVGDRGFAMSPGIGLGYGFLGEILGMESSQYWIVRATADFMCPVGERIGIINELGLFWGVAGGNDEYDVTGGPFLLFRSGLYFFY